MIHQKDELDRFYTKTEIAEFCIEKVKETITNFNEYIFIDPCVGNGAFYNLFDTANSIGIDINSNSDKFIKEDYLKWYPKDIKNRYLICSNPPFGVQNNLAIKFINHSAKFAEVIAFILPRSFKKESLYSRINKNFVYFKVFDLPKNSFLFNGKDYDVPCCFFIYVRGYRNETLLNLDTDYFTFCKQEEADCEIIRVGGRSGFCTKDIMGKKYNYFIKVNKEKISVDNFINKVNNIDFDCKNFTVGPRSISKKELLIYLTKK
jgi:hypothetical protein